MGLALAAAGIYVGETDDAPGAALLGLLLMRVLTSRAVKNARRKTCSTPRSMPLRPCVSPCHPNRFDNKWTTSVRAPGAGQFLVISSRLHRRGDFALPTHRPVPRGFQHGRGALTDFCRLRAPLAGRFQSWLRQGQILSSVFAALFVTSGLLFRRAIGRPTSD